MAATTAYLTAHKATARSRLLVLVLAQVEGGKRHVGAEAGRWWWLWLLLLLRLDGVEGAVQQLFDLAVDVFGGRHGDGGEQQRQGLVVVVMRV